jgi:ArsR family transcriptional regulator
MASRTRIPVTEVAAACEPLSRVPLDAERAGDLACALQALAEPTRLRIVSLIAASPEGEDTVNDIAAAVGVSQPTVSHHLHVLAECGFLVRDKRGTSAYYRLVPGSLDALSGLLSS